MKEVCVEYCSGCKYFLQFGCPCQKPICRIHVCPEDSKCKKSVKDVNRT